MAGLEKLALNWATPVEGLSDPFGSGNAFKKGWTADIADWRALRSGTVESVVVEAEAEAPHRKRRKRSDP